jgi:hypothetical protein
MQSRPQGDGEKSRRRSQGHLGDAIRWQKPLTHTIQQPPQRLRDLGRNTVKILGCLKLEEIFNAELKNLASINKLNCYYTVLPRAFSASVFQIDVFSGIAVLLSTCPYARR